MYIYTTPLKHGPQREKGGKLVKELHGGGLKDMKLTRGEMERMAKNREEWKSLVLALCASGCNKD